MTAPSTQGLVDAFARKVADRLDESKLDGPVRLDNTHTVVILPLKGNAQTYVHIHGGLDDVGAESVLKQISLAPGLKTLLRA
jgi:hypothetical protein